MIVELEQAFQEIRSPPVREVSCRIKPQLDVLEFMDTHAVGQSSGEAVQDLKKPESRGRLLADHPEHDQRVDAQQANRIVRVIDWIKPGAVSSRTFRCD